MLINIGGLADKKNLNKKHAWKTTTLHIFDDGVAAAVEFFFFFKEERKEKRNGFIWDSNMSRLHEM